MIAGLQGSPLSDSGRRLVIPLQCGEDATTGVAVVVLREAITFDERQLRLLTQIAELIGVAMEREVARRLAELDRAALYGQATHDPLTGLYNRLYLDDVAAQMCARDERRQSPAVAALMIDIDHFKRVNDTFGHQTGDEVLRRVATTIGAAVRAGDVPVRYGGEEFLVVLADIELADTWAIAERIRSSVASDPTGGPGVTVSIGVAMRHRGEEYDALGGPSRSRPLRGEDRRAGQD